MKNSYTNTLNPPLASELPPFTKGEKKLFYELSPFPKGGLRGIFKVFISFILLFLLNISVVFSSEISDSTNQNIDFSFTFGIGISADMDSISKHTDRSGLAFNFKFLVESFTNLSLGIETSYINISKFKQKNATTIYGLTDIDNQLTAIPILFIAQHKISFLQIFGGYGPSYIISEINSFGEQSISSEWDYSLLVGISYSYKINPQIAINAEAKYYTIPPLFKNILNGQISLTYTL